LIGHFVNEILKIPLMNSHIACFCSANSPKPKGSEIREASTLHSLEGSAGEHQVLLLENGLLIIGLSK